MASSARKSNVYKAKRLAEGQSIAIDGRGGDPGWQLAHVVTDLSFPWTKRKPLTTEFRALWSEQRLYCRFDGTNTDIVLGQGMDAMEKVIGSDRVDIFFSTGPNLNPYHAIEVDPRGEVLYYEARYHRQMNRNWSCDGLVVETSLRDSDYTVEGFIPRTTFLELDCLHDDEEGYYLCAGSYRAEFSHDPDGDPVIEDWMSWVEPEVASADFHVLTSFGTIWLVE